jgi:N-acetylneuraminic acid mutarotase
MKMRSLRVTHTRLTAVGVIAILFSSLTVPAAAAGPRAGRPLGPPDTWAPAGSMRAPRAGQTATLLPGGDVLVAGGGSATAELYDPATRAFTPTGTMPVTVSDATATLLPDGQVLVAGGMHGNRQVTDAELYDPATGTWSATGPMNVARSGQTATLLPDGDVLVAGGGCNPGAYCDAGSFLDTLRTAELYDPASGTWTLTGKMHVNREYQTATLLPGGQVLVAGGFTGCDDDFCSDTKTAELYDPATGKWAYTGSMHAAREQQTATLLPGGQVLVAGGYNEGGFNGNPFSYASAELYDPATGIWTLTAPMSTHHYGQTATLLPGGWVLISGGHTASAEIYEPQRGIWVSPGAMSVTRTDQTATLLSDGSVLVTGGDGPDGAPQDTAEVFLAGAAPLVSIAPGSLAFGGHQVGTTSRAVSYTVTNDGSADLRTTGVTVSGRNPGDFRASTDCTAQPVPPGGTCQVAVRFAPTDTALRTAVVSVADNAPRSPQPVTVTGYGGGPDTWVPVGSLPVPTEEFSAVLLHSGEVLVAGGEEYTGDPLANAELYNPATRAFTPTGSLNTPRAYPAMVLLPDGDVLIAGGYGASAALSSAELYDPASGTWSDTTPMNDIGYAMTATLLPDGDVLVTGFGGALGNRGEVYDPSTATWTNTGVMPSDQVFATATPLPDGEVLVTGGATKDAELYDPSTNDWTATGSMHVARQEATATLLPDGDVLVAGGIPPSGEGPTLSSAELYDPSTGTWTLTGSMTAARYGGTATLLTNGLVLATGGCSLCGDSPALSSTELFDGGFWDYGPAMTQPRVFQRATLLPGGDVLVVGGGTCYYCDGTPTAELFTPVLLSASPASGPADTQVTLTGNGFYAHEHVTLIWNGTRLGGVRAAADGTFTTKITVPAVPPGQYSLSAEGHRSFAYATTTFTVTASG